MKLIRICYYPVLAPSAGRYSDDPANHRFVVKLPEDCPAGPVVAADAVFRSESELWLRGFGSYNRSSDQQVAEMAEPEFEKLPRVDGCGPSIRRDPRY